MSCGVGHRHGSDPALLWLWCRPVAIALIRPLGWELPYAMGVALKRQKKKKKKKKERNGLCLLFAKQHKHEYFEGVCHNCFITIYRQMLAAKRESMWSMWKLPTL